MLGWIDGRMDLIARSVSLSISLLCHRDAISIGDAFDEEDNLPNFERVFRFASWDVTFSQISIRFLADLIGIEMVMTFDIIGL